MSTPESSIRTGRQADTTQAVRPRSAAAIQSILDMTGLSVPEFAREIGSSPSAVHRWLSGEIQPNLRFVQVIVSRFGVKPDVFFDSPRRGGEGGQ